MCERKPYPICLWCWHKSYAVVLRLSLNPGHHARRFWMRVSLIFCACIVNVWGCGEIFPIFIHDITGVHLWHFENDIFSVSDTGILGKRKSMFAQHESKGHRFNFWENSDFHLPSRPVSFTEKNIILIYSPGLTYTITFITCMTFRTQKHLPLQYNWKGFSIYITCTSPGTSYLISHINKRKELVIYECMTV